MSRAVARFISSARTEYWSPRQYFARRGDGTAFACRARLETATCGVCVTTATPVLQRLKPGRDCWACAVAEATAYKDSRILTPTLREALGGACWDGPGLPGHPRGTVVAFGTSLVVARCSLFLARANLHV